MKQIQQQLEQKKEQKASLLKQLETIKHEEEQLQQSLQILSSQKIKQQETEEETKSSSSKSEKEEFPEIQQVNQKPKKWYEYVEEEECPKIQSSNQESKKWYVIFNGPHKGIYNDWGIANSHIVGKNVTHKSYKSKIEAEAAYRDAYKTVTMDHVQHSSKTVLLGTPQKTTSLPKSLNQLNARKAFESIPTTKEKEAMKKPTAQKFAKLWDSLVSYTEVHSLMGFYPVLRHTGPKAIFLADLTDPMTLWDYFIHGFIDTIYLEGNNFHSINEFPSGIQSIIRQYKTRFAKQDRGLFIKMYSSYPFFDEDSQVLVPSITFAHMGISNGSKPSRDELVHETPTQDHLIYALSGVYLASSRIGKGKEQKSKVRINYASKTILIYSQTDSEITGEALKALETFEQPFENMSHYLTELPSEVKKLLCKHIMHAPRHNCSYCSKNTEEAPFMENMEE